MKQLELTPRLQTVADLVPQDAALADVGTDHAYLPVWLLLHDRVKSAVASDVKPGPLDAARRTAQRYGCAHRMQFLLCDGLDGIAPGQADTVVVAGMGGETICAILSRAAWIKDPAVTLLLQPMSRQHLLRRFLWQEGFAIETERLAREGDRLYTAMSVRYGGAVELTLAEEWAGRQYPELDQPLRLDYLNGLLDTIRRALAGIFRGTGGADDPRAQELRAAEAALTKMKEEWEQWQR